MLAFIQQIDILNSNFGNQSWRMRGHNDLYILVLLNLFTKELKLRTPRNPNFLIENPK